MNSIIPVLLLAALPLAAQPKLLTNAKLDSRSAAGGLEVPFKALLTAQPQPAWIGYSVPFVKGSSLGCEFVSPGGSAPGVVHLEPPNDVVVLFRVESNAVERLRTLSPDCEIDAGGSPVHWLADVDPAQSVALLSGMAASGDRTAESAISAIALHVSPAADSALERFIAPAAPEPLRRRAAFGLGAANSAPRLEILRRALGAGMPEAVEERAISGLGASRSPAATDFLISLSREDPKPRMRSQAISTLARKSGPKAVDTVIWVIQNDPDDEVKRRAVSALYGLPDGSGVPLLIQVAKSNPSASVRKQAMSLLGQSRDPRAAGFFEEVLRK